MRILYLLVTLITLLFSSSLYAQKFIWDVDFNFKFDNREYAGIDISPHKTLFGAFLTPQVGLEWEKHSVNLGVELMRNFGDKENKYGYQALLYYNYLSDKYRVSAGVFPRTKMIGEYSHAFFGDDVRYYDTTIEGLALQYIGDRGYSELIVDWRSMMGNTDREIFSIYSASNYQFNMFFLGYAFHMGHYVVDGVIDNILLNPYVGLDFSKILPLDVLDVKLGWLQSFQHDRETVGHYVFPKGGLIDISVEKWGVGIDNSLFLGQNMMPYYYSTTSDGGIHGAALYSGELFYSTDSGLYNRLEMYWRPLKKSKILDIKISFVCNFDGDGRFGTQQAINLVFNLGNIDFKKAKKPNDNENDNEKLL